MATQIQIPNSTGKAKVRNIWFVGVVSFFTLYVYTWFWWYFINRELRDLGRARGSSELGERPWASALAVSLGWLLIVPPFVSMYRTCQRVQAAQRIAGREEVLNGWMALVLLLLTTSFYLPFFPAYVQSELNKLWTAEWAVLAGAEPREALEGRTFGGSEQHPEGFAPPAPPPAPPQPELRPEAPEAPRSH
jgi:uncharacterized protein DUF4234